MVFGGIWVLLLIGALLAAGNGLTGRLVESDTGMCPFSSGVHLKPFPAY